MFNLFDVAVLIVIMLIAIFGFNVGILMSIFYFIAGFGGAWVAQSYASALGINYYIVFVVSALLFIVIGFIIKKIAGALFLCSVDKFLGLILGAVIGLWLVVSIMYPYALNMDKVVRETTVSSYFSQKVMVWLNNKFPVLNRVSISDLKSAFPTIKETLIKSKK